jgi:hypothetical protein
MRLNITNYFLLLTSILLLQVLVASLAYDHCDKIICDSDQMTHFYYNERYLN